MTVVLYDAIDLKCFGSTCHLGFLIFFIDIVMTDEKLEMGSVNPGAGNHMAAAVNPEHQIPSEHDGLMNSCE